jgi:hypothetical protein
MLALIFFSEKAVYEHEIASTLVKNEKKIKAN